VEELGESRRIIEERLGRPCPYLCWPYGEYSTTAAEIARDAGYRALFTTLHGVVTVGSDPFAIKRIVVKNKVKWFRKRMIVYTTPLLSSLYLAIKKK
jgi:peptidoglycan/xylan/chitin deacetylase (PgdA/CDA1 family)